MDERSKKYLGFATTLAQRGLPEALRTSQTIARPQSIEASVALPPVAYDASSDLVPVSELGRGGMGVVHLVTQKSLGRGVAVKSALSAEATVRSALVREAKIMGSLEHPNLVPVHALGQREDGTPILVMKHVEGLTLRELLDAPTHEGWKPLVVGHGDMLRAKVEILIQVCRALEFAHSRSVVHRDLKPDNVMIGRFGEVYLLDWGIAIRLTERATEPEALVGTPGYLAPEMAMADPTLVDERTDVYLLGGTLYEILTGRMPHDAAGAIAALMQALAGEPPSFEGVDAPAELVALVTKATAKNNADRISSVEAFREELARFLVFRDAEFVAQGARLAYARALASSDAGAERALFEARFGFMTALRMHPNDATIRQELQTTVERLVERQLALRSAQGARSILTELDDPPPAMIAKIEALERELAAERAAAEKMAIVEHEANTSAMARPLAGAMILGGALAGGVALLFAWRAVEGVGTYGPREALTVDLICVSIFGLAVVIWRRGLFATQASRRIAGAFIVAFVSMVLSDVLSYSLGDTPSEAAARSLAVAAMLGAAIALNVRPIWPVVPIMALGSLAAILFPSFALVVASAAIGVTFLICWRAFRLHAM